MNDNGNNTVPVPENDSPSYMMTLLVRRSADFEAWLIGQISDRTNGRLTPGSAREYASVLQNWVDRVCGGRMVDGVPANLFVLDNAAELDKAYRRIQSQPNYGRGITGTVDHNNFKSAVLWYRRWLDRGRM